MKSIDKYELELFLEPFTQDIEIFVRDSLGTTFPIKEAKYETNDRGDGQIVLTLKRAYTVEPSEQDESLNLFKEEKKE